jgi:hypothetical protein
VTGFVAAERIPSKALPAEEITPAVFADFPTSTAIMAMPITATAMETSASINLLPTFYPAFCCCAAGAGWLTVCSSCAKNPPLPVALFGARNKTTITSASIKFEIGFSCGM